MDLVASLPVTPKAWLFNSALAPHLDAFVAHLRRGRYATQTAKTHILGVAHFARWMTQCSLPVSLLNEQTTRQFMSNHLPRCNCPPPVLRLRTDLRAALGLLLVVLRQQGAVAQVAPPTGHIADELRRYDDHMRDARGLSWGTRRGCLRIVQRLLEHKFAGGLVLISELLPSDVRQFVAKQLERVGTVSNAMALASALRSYFQYRTTCGDRVHGLLGVIASPAHWRLASLPRALKPDEVDRLLASFNSSVPSPKRGYAIVRCALDMGLRIGEVAGLQLRDIDWGAGTVTLKHTKSLRQDILPLPAVTGQALADYLLHERPKTTDPAVFVRVLAPRDQPIGVDAISKVVRNAYRRIGLTHGRTHALRHTTACRLLEHGSSLKEVADVLRHRSMNTSLIYAKLDTPKLAAVALPWPGSAK
jgi:integrase/recombinase XerC